MRQRISRTQRNHTEGYIGSDQTLQHIIDCAIAATGKYRVTALRDCLASLISRGGRSKSRLRICFHARLLQNGERCFYVLHPPLAASPRKWVVKQRSFAHGIAILQNLDCALLTFWLSYVTASGLVSSLLSTSRWV